MMLWLGKKLRSHDASAYDTGPITGFIGQKTQIAIQMFEVDHCYPVKPEINRRLLIWLRIRD